MGRKRKLEDDNVVICPLCRDNGMASEMAEVTDKGFKRIVENLEFLDYIQEIEDVTAAFERQELFIHEHCRTSLICQKSKMMSETKKEVIY